MYFKSLLDSLDSGLKYRVTKLLSSSSPPSQSPPDHEAHDALNAITWSSVSMFMPSTPKVHANLKVIASIVAAGVVRGEEPARVLDVGCGDGVMCDVLGKAFRKANKKEKNRGGIGEYVGIDIAEGMIERARRMRGGEGTWRRVKFQDFEVGGERSGFDVVLFNGSWHYIPQEDVGGVLGKAGDLLGGGGKVVISHYAGRGFVEDEKRKNGGVVVGNLPGKKEVEGWEGWKIEEWRDEGGIFVAVIGKEGE